MFLKTQILQFIHTVFLSHIKLFRNIPNQFLLFPKKIYKYMKRQI